MALATVDLKPVDNHPAPLTAILDELCARARRPSKIAKERGRRDYRASQVARAAASTIARRAEQRRAYVRLAALLAQPSGP